MTGSFPIDEESFRAALDADGFFPESRATDFDEGQAFLVFAQREDARFDMGLLTRQAQRFFDAHVGWTVDKHYDRRPDVPRIDAARIVISSKLGIAGTRTVLGRPRTPADAALADSIELASRKGGGLALLARRCRSVWLVSVEDHENDRAALLLAAILASVDLGPIVSPARDVIFGVKTARVQLEANER